MKAITLAELVQQRRIATHELVADSSARRLTNAERVSIAADPGTSRHVSSASISVVDQIESLAIQLLIISKSGKADPEATMREALVSIDRCIVSIASKH